MSGDDGLREVIARALHHDWHADEEWDAIPDSVCGYYRRLADVTLALPELAALRAKADAADRVRALVDELEAHREDYTDYRTRLLVDHVANNLHAALDGPAPC